jgi:hypothetical protein
MALRVCRMSREGSDRKRVAGLFPVIAPFECAFGIDQDVGHVLDIAHLGIAAADFQ